MARIRTQDVEIQRKPQAPKQGKIRKEWCGPLPIAPMLDAVIVGEVEPIMDGLQEVFLGGGSRRDQIERLSHLPGVYVPSRYEIAYASDGTISHVSPTDRVALPVARLNARNVNDFQTMSAVASPDIQ